MRAAIFRDGDCPELPDRASVLPQRKVKQRLMGQSRLFGITAGFLLLVGILAACGCAKTSSAPDDIQFSIESDPVAAHVGANTFTVTLTDKDGVRLTGAHIAMEGDMTHPGMSPAFGEAKEVAPGKYQCTLDLTMRGDWTILFHITLANGRSVERQLQIQSLRAN